MHLAAGSHPLSPKRAWLFRGSAFAVLWSRACRARGRVRPRTKSTAARSGDLRRSPHAPITAPITRRSPRRSPRPGSPSLPRRDASTRLAISEGGLLRFKSGVRRVAAEPTPEGERLKRKTCEVLCSANCVAIKTMCVLCADRVLCAGL